MKNYLKILCGLRNYKSDEKLDEYFKTAFHGEIIGITEISYHDNVDLIGNIEISFSNGSRIVGWHLSRFFAWLSRGSIHFDLYEIGDGTQVYVRDNAMPSRLMMLRLYRRIMQYYKKHGKEPKLCSEDEIRETLKDIVREAIKANKYLHAEESLNSNS